MSSRLRHCLPHFVMLLVSVLLYGIAARIDAPAGRVGPDFWPKAIIVFMGLLCVIEIAKRLVIGVAPAAPPPEAMPGPAAAATAAPPATVEDEPWRPGMLFGGGAAILGYVVLVPWLGFFLSTLAFLCSFAWIGGFRRPALNLLIGLGGSVLTLVLFMRVAYISLPLGEGPFRQFSLALLKLIGVS